MNDYITQKWTGGLLKDATSPRILPKSEFLLKLESAQAQAAASQEEQERRAAEDRHQENRRILGLIDKAPSKLLRMPIRK